MEQKETTSPSTPSPDITPGITIRGNFVRSINFAMQQNYVPIIRNLTVQNETGNPLTDLDLKVRFQPDFAREYTCHLEEIPTGQSVEVTPVRISLKTEYLFSLTEKLLGQVTVELFQGQECLHTLETEIELLAPDQWSGLLFMPEVIAAFVTPNHPRIAHVLQDASKLLQQWTGNPSFTGYQTRNPNHVKLQMAAIYGALQQLEIVYNSPPATYEIVGQRVRLPHTVLEQKQGTCLDLSLLYAACLEAVGLYPLLLFVKGHAFGGCHLEEETFADCVVDDVSAIEKRTAAGAEELLLVECTAFVSGRNDSFDLAIQHARNRLAPPEQFTCVIDIQRTRSSGIRPIPLQLPSQDTQEAEEGTPGSRRKSAQAPLALDQSLRDRVVEGEGMEPLTKQKLWERKLLDFSLRNTLLNFRVTKNAFQLMAADLCELEDQLSEGKDFRILEMPSEWTDTLRDSQIFEMENQKDLIRTIATQEFKSSRIRTFLSEAELDKRLKGLYRSAKMSMEENGSNTLFLALGFLRWYETNVSEKARYAPLVLLSVDIVRSVRNKGFVIRSRQEEVQMNVTLLEYLRQDHGILISGLDPLPEDEHGVDLRLVFHTIRQAVMAKKRWNVEEMAFLGLFSFGQFVMWNDIRNRADEISRNKVVASLIDGRMNWEPGQEKISAQELDACVSLSDMAIPVSADSSQMVAITAAAQGESFVLHGPPGTGKSQTITNMIANALFQGKSVLFVAEKMAALNVVQKRLADIGLDPFCLELHSNKTNKGTVLARLGRTLEAGRIKPPEEHLQTAEKIHSLRLKLNSIVEALHQQRKYGLSLYESIERYERYAEHKGKILLRKSSLPGNMGNSSEEAPSPAMDSAPSATSAPRSLADMDKAQIGHWEELVRQYKVAALELGTYAEHPLVGYEDLEYSMERRDRLQEELALLLEKCRQADRHLAAICQWAAGIDDGSRQMTKRLLKAAEAAILPAMTLGSLLEAPNFQDLCGHLRRLAQTGKEYRQVYGRLEEIFAPAIFSYEAEAASRQWKQADAKWFLPRAFAQNKLVKELRLYAKDPGTVTKDRMPALYGELCLLQEHKRKILETPPQLTGLLPRIYLELSTDWDALEASLDKAVSLAESCSSFGASQRKALTAAICQGDIPSLAEHVAPLRTFLRELESFCAAWHIDLEQAGRTAVSSTPAGENWLEQARQLFARYRANLDELRNKVAFNQADTALLENGLLPVSEAYKKGIVSAQDLEDAFAGNLYYELTLLTIAGDKRLASFHGKQYDDCIAQYREAIARYQQLTIQELAARLSAQIPSPGGASASSSELGILKKAIRNNGRMLSLRKLFDQIPTLLRKLCPCMLMSPISVAQYIDPSFPRFDLVIFDEASQLPTSEAVGTIARGENVVIVGDPKQLPPTNFFSANRIDEENSEKEDLESLLDDCLAISMPQESLKWHYRSRHESLIAYSNMQYYDNKLYTFPSPSDLKSEVKMVHLEGFYDKGKTKQNRAEAQAIVAEVLRRLTDDTLRHDSIGVVTFSSSQQNLIDDLLFEEFKKHPELEELDRNSREPVFIKNLENVQGDERDVILFSVGYGPDAAGNVSMNFGPLNRDGGWRRLNVAISRARKSMIVYSVLRSDQIDLARTRSEGVAGLKGFLEFAEKGQNALIHRTDTGRGREDSLIQDIACAIQAMGYQVKCNIGCSQFKMDLGVVDPRNQDTYLLGILLDGENCKEAATARDRFVLQPDVLCGLGWHVLRIWTLDWLDDAARVLSAIRGTLEALTAAQHQKPGSPSPVNGTVSSDTQAGTASAPSEASPLSTDNPSVFATLEKMDATELPTSGERPYIPVRITPMGAPEEFYMPQNRARITRLAQTILETESPVSKRLLMRKVFSAFGLTRSGSRVDSTFYTAIAKIEKTITRDDDREFYWRQGQSPDTYEGYRVSSDEEYRRTMDDIPSEEILNAVMEVLQEQVSLSQTDLIKETARKFGFSRMGSVIEGAVGYALQKGVAAGRLQVLESGKYAL